MDPPPLEVLEARKLEKGEERGWICVDVVTCEGRLEPLAVLVVVRGTEFEEEEGCR